MKDLEYVKYYIYIHVMSQCNSWILWLLNHLSYRVKGLEIVHRILCSINSRKYISKYNLISFIAIIKIETKSIN